MWTDLFGWTSSVILLVLLASQLRRLRADGRSGSVGWILGELAAMTTLLCFGMSLGGLFLLATAALLGSNLALLLVREWRARRQHGYTIVLQAANDDGAELKLRVLSHVLEAGEMPLYQSR